MKYYTSKNRVIDFDALRETQRGATDDVTEKKVEPTESFVPAPSGTVQRKSEKKTTKATTSKTSRKTESKSEKDDIVEELRSEIDKND